MYSINSIQKDDLIRLAPLLQESFGDAFELDDEITYFSQSLALSWFFLADLGEPQGFIRCFEIETDLFLIDLYLKSSHQKKIYYDALLNHFQQNNHLSENIRGRIDTKKNQTELISVLKKQFPNHQCKRFIYYELQLKPNKNGFLNQTLTKDNLEQTRQILSCLKQYSCDELVTLYDEKKLFIYWIEGKPVSALHFEPITNETCEIITLATQPKLQSKGYGEALLINFFNRVGSRFKKVVLKVEEENHSAIRLYEKTKFNPILEKSEIWWYFPINQSGS